MLVRWFTLTILLVLLGYPVAADSGPQTTVLWISVDGFRPDYIDHERTPYLTAWATNELYSDRVTPVTPSLTFPSHTSQATGTPVATHGISANAFYDAKTEELLIFPGQSELLEAEPIWQTASRQGLDALVYDWPLSHNQVGANKARYFLNEFERDLSDRERLERVLTTWNEHPKDSQLRLVMGYIEGTDVDGHGHGPDSDEVREKSKAVDKLLTEFIARAHKIWESRRSEGDSLVVVVTSDHGMEKVHTLVHPGKLFGLDEVPKTLATSGNVANYHLPTATSLELAAQVEHLNSYDFLQAYQRSELPAEWFYDHPTRVGDIVVFLDPGYTFSKRAKRLQVPVEEVGGPMGMHGYVPVESEAMNSVLLMQRFPVPFPTYHLGRVHSFGLHATIAKFLGIEPSPEAAPAFNLPSNVLTTPEVKTTL